MAVIARILTGVLTYGLGAVLGWLALRKIVVSDADQQWLKDNVPTLALILASIMATAAGVLWTKYIKPRWDKWTAKKPPDTGAVPFLAWVALGIGIACSLACGGCATEARHGYTNEACNQILSNSDSMQTLALDYSTGAGAKALADLKRLDDALMLKIEIIAKATYTDDKARQAAILEAMTTYKTDVATVETDKSRVRDRDGKFRELVDATKEAAAGLLMVEARSWANKALATELYEAAVVGKFFNLAPKPASTAALAPNGGAK